MAGGGVVKGTIRPLAECISEKEAERAAKQIQEAIVQQQQQLNDFERFFDDNNSLSKLVLELPDSVTHRIMVPFGKAAFFPGRLVHTNEFLVLLGEGHYAERSARQTVEILGRRSELLERKIDGAKAQIADLEAESSFATNAAEEARAGLVEIREEYTGSGELQVNQASSSSITLAGTAPPSNPASRDDTGPSNLASTSSNSSITAEDPEHDILMARLSELELAEAAAGDYSSNEDSEEVDEEEEEKGDVVDEDSHAGGVVRSDLQRSIVSGKAHKSVLEENESEETEEDDRNSLLGVSSEESDSEEEEDYDQDAQRSSPQETSGADDCDIDCRNEDLGQSLPGVSSNRKMLSRFASEAYSNKGALDSQNPQRQGILQGEQPVEKKPQSATLKEMFGKRLEKPKVSEGFNELQKDLEEWRRDGSKKKGHVLGERNDEESRMDIASVKGDRRVQKSGKPGEAPPKAFTGTVTERTSAGLGTSPHQQARESQSTRPISKFRMRHAEPSE